MRNSIAGGTPGITEVEGLESKRDSNNVSVDREARLVAENALRFTVAANLMRKELLALRNAIEEERNA